MKKELQDLIQKVKDKQWKEGQGKELMTAIQEEQTKALGPVLDAMGKGMTERVIDAITKALFGHQEMMDKMAEGITKLKVDSPVLNIPEIKVPEAHVNVSIPPIKVPTPIVNFDTSKIYIAPPVMPDEMKVTGAVSLKGIDDKHPLPVQLRDKEGKPVDFFGGMTQIIGSGGGKTDFLTIKGFSQSAFSVPVNSDGEVKVAGTFTAGAPASTFVIPGNSEGIVYNSDNPLPVAVMSGATATSAVNVVDSSGVAYSGSNPLPVSASMVLNQAQDQGESDGRTLRVVHAGDVGVSTNIIGGSVAVSGITGSVGATILNGEGLARDSWLVSDVTASIKSALVDSSGIQYSGSNPVPVTGSMAVSGITGSIGATILNGEGVARDSWLISDITNSIKSVLIDSSGIQYSGSNPIPTRIVTDASSSLNVSLVDSGGVAYNDTNGLPIRLAGGTQNSLSVHLEDSSGIGYDGSNPMWVRVSSTGNTTGVNLHDSSGIGYSGSNPLPITGSVAVSGVTGSLGATILNGEGLARDSWLVSDITASVKTSIIDSSGVGYSGSNPLPITWISGSGGGATTASATVDSSGVQYSGSNPMPVILVGNMLSSTAVSGAIAENAAGDGVKPVQIGGIARQTNPGARTDGNVTSFSADDLGRQITRPVQVRDLIATAYVSKTTGSTFGTETALFSGITNTYNDLIYVLASNDSTVAIGFDIRASLAGNIMMHIEIPANSTAGVSLPVPIPAGDVGASWTVDFPDVTGTNTYVSALFSKEV